MATSPAHKFGQIIGGVLEKAVAPLLSDFADEHALFLDRKGLRPARRGRKVTWVDAYGNTHDLDFVLERGGTRETVGTPVAFIEVAWRSYTKHSRNKVQEIQGAVRTLWDAYRSVSPFMGAVLAGVFTEGALTQLRSVGFTVLFFPVSTVTEAFASVGLDARFGEHTPREHLAAKVDEWNSLPPGVRERVPDVLIDRSCEEVKAFMTALERSVTRTVDWVRVVTLHGQEQTLASLEDAIAFIASYHEAAVPLPLVRYEVQVRYCNGDSIDGRFAGKEDAVRFLRGFLPPSAG